MKKSAGFGSWPAATDVSCRGWCSARGQRAQRRAPCGTRGRGGCGVPRVCLWVGSESGVRITHLAKVCEHLLGTEGCAPRSGEHG